MARATFYTDRDSAPQPNRPRRVGVAAALFRADAVLLEYRSDSDFWAFLSGGVKDDESVMTAVRREIHEETSGARAADLSLYAVYSNPGRITAYPDGNVSQIITMAFVGDLIGERIAVSAESRALEFFALTDLPTIGIAPTHRAFADDLVAHGRHVAHTLVD